MGIYGLQSLVSYTVYNWYPIQFTIIGILYRRCCLVYIQVSSFGYRFCSQLDVDQKDLFVRLLLVIRGVEQVFSELGNYSKWS